MEIKNNDIYILQSCDLQKTYSSAKIIAASTDYNTIIEQIAIQIMQGNMTYSGCDCRIESYILFMEKKDDFYTVQSCLDYGMLSIFDNAKSSDNNNILDQYFVYNDRQMVFSKVTVAVAGIDDTSEFFMPGIPDSDTVLDSHGFESFIEEHDYKTEYTVAISVFSFGLGSGEEIEPTSDELCYIENHMEQLQHNDLFHKLGNTKYQEIISTNHA